MPGDGFPDEMLDLLRIHFGKIVPAFIVFLYMVQAEPPVVIELIGGGGSLVFSRFNATFGFTGARGRGLRLTMGFAMPLMSSHSQYYQAGSAFFQDLTAI
jgi:hypothetical protein